jgi:hypothetical protein
VGETKTNIQIEIQLLRELDKRQNELLPQIALSQTEVHIYKYFANFLLFSLLQFHFGTVYFDQPAVAVLSIKNTGQTPTHFNFKTANPEKIEHEKWLTITPQSSFLDVG